MIPTIRTTLFSLLAVSATMTACASSTPSVEKPGESSANLPESPPQTVQRIGTMEPVALLSGPMPTGVAVSKTGRIFLNFPKWGDPVDFTVGELKDGKVVAYPNEAMNKGTPKDFTGKLVSVQSVVVDQKDRLWLVDTGSEKFGPVTPGAAKLIAVDLKSNKPVKTITFASDVVLPTSYINDVRFDLKRGKEGFAFLTDSSDRGANGIIVVDLASGKSWRRLHDNVATKAAPNFVPTVEGRPFMIRVKSGTEESIRLGSDGLAMSSDGKQLYFCSLASRKLFRVSVDALANPKKSEADVAATVEDLGDRVFASDGLETAANGAVYLTDYENNAVRRRNDDGTYTIVASGPELIWPDSMSATADGYLYVTANQLNRQAKFQEGTDKRKMPYSLFRMKVS